MENAALQTFDFVDNFIDSDLIVSEDIDLLSSDGLSLSLNLLTKVSGELPIEVVRISLLVNFMDDGQMVLMEIVLCQLLLAGLNLSYQLAVKLEDAREDLSQAVGPLVDDCSYAVEGDWGAQAVDVDPAGGASGLSADEGSFAERVGAHSGHRVSFPTEDFRVLNLHGVKNCLKFGITKMFLLHNKYSSSKIR